MKVYGALKNNGQRFPARIIFRDLAPPEFTGSEWKQKINDSKGGGEGVVMGGWGVEVFLSILI